MHNPRKKYNLSPPIEHLSSDTPVYEDGRCHLNNGNSSRNISNPNGNDTAYELHSCAQSDVNLDTQIPIFESGKFNQQHRLMGHELSSNSHCQETLNDEDGCSIRDIISKTNTLLSSPSIIVQPHCTVNNIKYILTPSWEQGTKIHHTVQEEVILSGINCDPIMPHVPDNTTTVLKNPVDVFERKLFLTGTQANSCECDRFPLDVHTLEKELVFVLQKPEASLHRNALLLNTVDIGQSPSNVFLDYLENILIRADMNISSGSKFLENCSSAINMQYVPSSGSCKTHTISDTSDTSEVSASENCHMLSEGFGMLAVGLDVVYNYHHNLIQDRVCRIVRETDLSVPQRRISLQTMHALWSALPIIHTPLYNSHLNCFNTAYLWQETDKNQILETYSALSRSSHIQTGNIKNSNSDTFQKHSSPLVDSVPSNESSRQIILREIMKLFDDREVICEDSIYLPSGVVLQKDTVRAESGVAASSDQNSLNGDRNKPSTIIMQKKPMAADAVYDLCDFTRDSSDTAVKGQKIRSLSQPSLPTYLLHDSTDDEQLSENFDEESDYISETFREYEDFYEENKSEFLAANRKGKHIEIAYNEVNIVTHEIADTNKNVYTLQSDSLYNTAVTEFKGDNTLTELYNKSQKLYVNDDMTSFHKGRKMPYPVSPERDTFNEDLILPFGNIQDTNTVDGDDRNILRMESEIIENIIAIEDDVIDREYTSSDKQHLFIPMPHNQMFREHKVAGNVQCNMCNLPDISDSWNRSGNKTCSEEAETRLLSECSSNSARCKICRVTWASDTKGHEIQNEITTTQTHEAHEKTCHSTVAHSRTGNRCEPCTVKGNICSPECITVKESQNFTRPVLSNIMCSNGNYVSYEYVPDQNHTVFPNSHPEPVSNSCKNSYDQNQPVSCPCVENCHSHNQIRQVHNNSQENTLDSCIEMAIKKYETEVPRQSRYMEVKPTKDVTVQTNIRSLIGLGNQKGCFVCFSNNHFNVSRTGTHHNLASKRNFEALDLESASLHKKPRYDTLKLVHFEPDVSKLLTNLNSKSEKSETTYGSCPDNGNEENDFQNMEHLELQDNSVMNRQNSVDSDQKVPDVVNDVSWMEDDMIEKELYLREKIVKASSKHDHIFEWHNQYQLPRASKSETKETAHQSHTSVRRSIRVGLSRRAQPLPLHPRHPQQCPSFMM